VEDRRRNERTATLRSHDCDDGVGEAAGGEIDGPDEAVEAGDVELAVAVDELRGAAIVVSHGEEAEVEVEIRELKN